jgi:hypothetical protein
MRQDERRAGRRAGRCAPAPRADEREEILSVCLRGRRALPRAAASELCQCEYLPQSSIFVERATRAEGLFFRRALARADASFFVRRAGGAAALAAARRAAARAHGRREGRGLNFRKGRTARAGQPRSAREIADPTRSLDTAIVAAARRWRRASDAAACARDGCRRRDTQSAPRQCAAAPRTGAGRARSERRARSAAGGAHHALASPMRSATRAVQIRLTAPRTANAVSVPFERSCAECERCQRDDDGVAAGVGGVAAAQNY